MTDKPQAPLSVEDKLTTRQASLVAKVHQRTIVAWIRRGLLPAERLPGGRGRYLIDPHDLEQLVSYLATPVPYEPGT